MFRTIRCNRGWYKKVFLRDSFMKFQYQLKRTLAVPTNYYDILRRRMNVETNMVMGLSDCSQFRFHQGNSLQSLRLFMFHHKQSLAQPLTGIILILYSTQTMRFGDSESIILSDWSDQEWKRIQLLQHRWEVIRQKRICRVVGWHEFLRRRKEPRRDQQPI